MRPGARRAALSALGLTALAGCSAPGPTGAPETSSPAAGAGDAVVRSTPVVPGRPARVFVFAGFGKSCEPVAAPEITVIQPPTKGDVSLVPGQETTVQYSVTGTCVGQKTTGTGVYYTARAGATGSDHFSVTARLASGETATRSFDVRIAE